MRLLESTADHDLSLTEDLDEDDIPPYAILSHTWGSNEEEVTYKDLADGTAKVKSGYRKILFCQERASHDGQTYSWVDTCCIDKTNHVELNTAITSMFDWYAKATKCYVYLSDVERGLFGTAKGCNVDWRSQFRNCRWLTRGWTLQELLAPRVVEFYDQTGTLLGDKTSLENDICEVTGIPAAALQGRPLTSYSIEERLAWQRNRRTKKPEDVAYSLSGICGVSMIPVYGEGRVRAMARLRKEIDDVFQGPKRQNFSIPFGDARMTGVEKFVGREKELQEMHAALLSDGGRRSVVLSGLGGIGKTQLAIAYARRHRDAYSAIFWLNMQDASSAGRSLILFARRVLQHHPCAPYLSQVDLAGSPDEIAVAVMAWLSMVDNTRWLAICDNYDNPRIGGNTDSAAVDIRDFLPQAFQGSVIVTTRSSLVKIGRSMPVRKLVEVQEAVEILSNNSNRSLSANALLSRLDGLPLALATTGSYLDQVTVSIAEYLELYQSSWLQVHEDDPGLDTYADRTLRSTWQVSLDRIEQQNELSSRLLRLWCYFGNQDLWYELVRDGPTEALPWLGRLTASLPVFTRAMRLLCSYGLAQGDSVSEDSAGSGGYSIHACVHSWAIQVLNKEWNHALATFAVRAIWQHVPEESSPEPWLTQRRLLPHVDRCLMYLPVLESTSADTTSSLHEIGNLYYDQGKMQEAEAMYLRALEGREEAWGPKHTSTLNSVNNLGILYKNHGKMQEAEAMYLRALEGREEAWGPKHTSTLNTVNNLGNLYKDQGKMQEAEAMYLRALKGKEDAWGPKHTSTLDTVFNLSIFYSNQRRNPEAERMCLRAIEGYKDVEESHDSDIAFLQALLTELEVGRVPRQKSSKVAFMQHARAEAAKEDTRKLRKRDRIFRMLRRT
ncbi:hypothetical protein KC356_g8821 [Hortaea werneckii]|nr:hypothetical protein KC356_g8821 [Hortaea werneckii]